MGRSPTLPYPILQFHNLFFFRLTRVIHFGHVVVGEFLDHLGHFFDFVFAVSDGMGGAMAGDVGVGTIRVGGS